MSQFSPEFLWWRETTLPCGHFQPSETLPHGQNQPRQLPVRKYRGCMCQGAETRAVLKQVLHVSKVELLPAPALSGGVEQGGFIIIVALFFPGSRKIHNLMKKYLLRRSCMAWVNRSSRDINFTCFTEHQKEILSDKCINLQLLTISLLWLKWEYIICKTSFILPRHFKIMKTYKIISE